MLAVEIMRSVDLQLKSGVFAMQIRHPMTLATRHADIFSITQTSQITQ